jgi:Ribbon-helix-helix protein, copG family
MHNFKTTSMTFDQTTIDLLEGLCKKTGMTRSGLLRQLIAEAARRQEKVGNVLLGD